MTHDRGDRIADLVLERDAWKEYALANVDLQIARLVHISQEGSPEQVARVDTARQTLKEIGALDD